MALRPQRPTTRSDQLAQRDAAQQDVFMREVDEAVRQDEFLSLARRYGRPLAVLVVAGLLALGGFLWWQHHREGERAEQGEKLTLALDRVEGGNLPAAEKELAALATSNNPGAAATAKMLQAGIALQQNRHADAVRLFAEVSEDGDAPQPLRDLATIRQVATGFEAMPPQTVVSRLKPLAVPGNPWFGSAGELLAMAYLKQGRSDLAGPLLASVARDKDTPESLRRRTRQMAGVLGVDAIDDVARAAGGDAPGAAGAAPAQ